jgi:hypothetical protein
MRIDTNLIIDMFKQALERIIELISEVLKKMKGSNLKMIFLVGGFSGSGYSGHYVVGAYVRIRLLLLKLLILRLLELSHGSLERQI